MEDEILTLEEIASYLRVSERTVYEWAQKGEIPCGKIGVAWRFKRSEIEKWVDSKLSAVTKDEKPRREIQMSQIVSPERILITNFSTKHDVFISLIDRLAESPQVKNRKELEDTIFDREELMSTALGRKIAIPHVRLDSVSDLLLAIAISKKEILDFNPLDGVPVRLVFMIVANSKQHAYYLQVLSHLMLRLKSEDFVEELLACQSSDEAYKLLVGSE